MKFVAYVFAAVLMLASLSISAHEYSAGSIFVHHPAANATPKGADMAVGYFMMKNSGDRDDVLLSVEAPTIADTVEIHTMTTDANGTMQMRKIDGGLTIPARQSVLLSPDGTHIMFTKIKQPLVAGQHYNATLVFKIAGRIQVYFSIEPMGSMPTDGYGHSMKDMK